jgi:peptidoglycan/LPS O-acetylase OafA/YrhL
MKNKILISMKILLIIVGAMFVLFAIDVFGMDYKWYELLFGFFISILPGIVLIALVYFLWKRERQLGIVITLVGIFMVVFFGAFEEFPERLGTLIVVLPVVIAGLILYFYGSTKNKE